MKERLKKYFNSTLNPQEFDEIADSIQKGKNSTAINQMMKEVWDEEMKEKVADKSNPMLFKNIQQSIISEEREKAKKKLRIYTIGLRIAAVLVIGLLISTLFFYQSSNNKIVKDQIQTVSIPYGSVTSFNLPDGSLVWLNSGSRLVYNTNFTDKRQIELSGEAYFEVVKSKIPFVVNTSLGDIKVLGTTFNVQAYDNEDFITTLLGGKVELRNNNGKNNVVLMPGQQAVYEKGSFKLGTVDTERYISWKDGKMIFEREPFSVLVKRLERWYNVKIKYPNEIKDLWYTGTIEMETLAETMEMLSIAAPIQYSYDKKTRTITLNVK